MEAVTLVTAVYPARKSGRNGNTKRDDHVNQRDTALVQQILDIAKGQREPDVDHHRWADDLWGHFKVAERAVFSRAGRYFATLAGFNQVPPTGPSVRHRRQPAKFRQEKGR